LKKYSKTLKYLQTVTSSLLVYNIIHT